MREMSVMGWMWVGPIQLRMQKTGPTGLISFDWWFSAGGLYPQSGDARLTTVAGLGDKLLQI